MNLFSLPPKIFGSLYFVYNHSPHKTKFNSRSLKEIFLGYSRTQKSCKYFCSSIGRYILFADVIFFSLNLKFSYLFLRQRMTMITCSIGRQYSIVAGQYLKMWLVKIHFDFRIRFISIDDETLVHVLAPDSVPNPAQKSSETVTAQLPGTSATDDLPIAFQKGKRMYSASSFQFCFLFSFIVLLSFIYFFIGLMLDFQECIKNTLFQVGLRRYRRRWRS